MSRPRDASVPMRLLVLGNFSGEAAGRPGLASRPTYLIDLDTVASVMRRLAPRLKLAQGDVTFHEIDDFHPDRLFAQLEVFRALREKRANPPADDSDFTRLLGQPGETVAPPPAAPLGRLDALIREMIAPHIVKDTSAHDKMYVEAVDAAIALEMRALLHAPAVQRLEADWRGVHWLISNLELDETLQLHLFDVTREEILADVTVAGGKITSTGLYQALVDRWRNVPGANGWTAFVTLFEFDQSDADIGLLAALGLIAAQAGALILGGAASMPADDAVPADEAGWNALRRSEVAPWIALGAPRVLMRLPYGARTEPITAFAFEEVSGEPGHGDLLWGSAALALALLIGQAFTARGWDMEPGDAREIAEMPAYTFTRDGESHLQPCSERPLSEIQMQKLLDAGLIPLASRRDRPAVVAIRFQSIAYPPAPLVW